MPHRIVYIRSYHCVFVVSEIGELPKIQLPSFDMNEYWSGIFGQSRHLPLSLQFRAFRFHPMAPREARFDVY